MRRLLDEDEAAEGIIEPIAPIRATGETGSLAAAPTKLA